MILCDWYTDISLIFSSLSSNVKGLSKEGGSKEPSGSAPVLYFNHNHDNNVSKKLTNKYTKN